MTLALAEQGKNRNAAALERSTGTILNVQKKTGGLIYQYEVEIFIL